MSIHRRDIAMCVLLFAAMVAYLYAWPRDFNTFDEGVYLYEAKRVLDGDVMYRDFFEILTPASFYFMASLFALFGVGMETARIGMAVVHGGIGVLLYAICRQMKVRFALALLASLTPILLGYPLCSIASPHWISTFGMMVLVAVVLRWPATTMRRALLWGMVAGTLILIQQHRGVFIAGAAALVLVVDGRRAGTGALWPPLLRSGVAFLAGVLGVVGPVMLGFVAAAGAESVLRALVWHPLFNYRAIHNDTGMWSVYFSTLFFRKGSWISSDVAPLAYVNQHLPLVIPITAAVLAWRWRRYGDDPRGRALWTLLIFSTFAVLSVGYHPNPVHFAFVAPVWAALAALLIEMLLSAVERAVPRLRMVAAAVVTILVVGAVWQLEQTRYTRRTWVSMRAPTAFGRVDVGTRDHLAELQFIADALRSADADEMFVFPASPGLYLLMDTLNPTRFELVLPDGYTDADQIDEVVATLEARQVPIVIQTFYFSYRGLEPLRTYLKRQYEMIGPPVPPGGFPLTKVFRRRPDECAASPIGEEPKQRRPKMCSAHPG